jgi:Raf kinase inhibitor-like YbhB/YbcL family protein
VHWIVYAIPADARSVPEGAPRDPELADPAGARQGINSWPADNVGYRGPMPPPGHGVHHYHFKLYALDAAIDLPAGTTDKAALLAAMQGHILDEAELIGTYER